MTELLTAQDVHVGFRIAGRRLHAVDGVSLHVSAGETVGLVGESGSGKSTLALTLMRMYEPDRGRIVFQGQDITHLPQRRLTHRRALQMVFQDPYASLDPRMTVGRIVAEPLRAHGERGGVKERVAELLEQVGLPASAARRMPAQFSGGQRQRIGIARALALRPKMLIADEPVSALDVSLQAQIVDLLEDIQQKTGIAYLVVAHDLALVHHIADRVLVMYLGRVVESGPADEVIATPQHPYTAALLSATPTDRRRERIVLRGDPPSAVHRPTGCHFHPRCPIAQPKCAVEPPPLVQVAPGRLAACHYAGEVLPPLDLSPRPAVQPSP